MNQISKQFSSIEQVTGKYLKKSSQGQMAPGAEVSFGEILRQKQSVNDSPYLKFSKHASMRLESRNIELSTEQQERLETGAQKAEAKGMKESLVTVDSYSFIVNLPNKTVVTAMDHTESKENIYTNIDGAVII